MSKKNSALTAGLPEEIKTDQAEGRNFADDASDSSPRAYLTELEEATLDQAANRANQLAELIDYYATVGGMATDDGLGPISCEILNASRDIRNALFTIRAGVTQGTSWDPRGSTHTLIAEHQEAEKASA